MAGVPYVFGNATTSIPLSNLDADFNTPVTIGNTTVGLGNTVTTLGNVTLNNVTITSGSINAAVTQSGFTANAVIYSNTGGNLTTSANLTFDGSTLTTLNSAYTGTLTGGTGVVNLGSGQFYKDASGNVGIGVTSPAAYLSFKSGDTSDKANSIRLFDVGGTNGNNYGFGVKNSTGEFSATAGTGGFFTWYTANAERMRINSSGKVGIGTTAPISKLTVIGSGGFDGTDATYSGTIQIADDVASAQAVGGLEFKSSSFGSGYGWKICNIDPGGGTPLTVNYRENSATWTEGFRFKSGGLFILQGGSTSGGGTGISFPATQSASSDANTLDDYEKGTWTPVLTASTSGTITTTDRSGTYTKVGNIVTVQGYFNVASVSSPVGDFRVGGLPFTANASYGYGAAAIQPYGFAITTTVTAYYALQASNATYFTIRGFLNGDQVSNIANNVKASTGMQFTVTYQVA